MPTTHHLPEMKEFWIKFELPFLILSILCGKQSIALEIPNFILNNGRRIPSIGFGTWMAKDQDLEIALDEALEAGYRYIDTAYLYENEKVIGKVLKRWIAEKKLKREDLFILSKLPPSGNRPEGVSKYLKKSLENLQLDYLDMYLIHVPFAFKEDGNNLYPLAPDNRSIDMDSTTDLRAIWQEMEQQVNAGLTKSIGLSNFNVTQIERVLKNSWIKPSALQIELNLYLQQKKLVEFCKENNILVIAYSPLGSPGLRKFYEQFKEKIDLPDLLGDRTVKAIADKYSKKTSQIILRFYIQSGIVPIPKSINPSRIRMNLDIFDFQLDDQDMGELKSLDKNRRILHFSDLFKGIQNHPEYPFKEQ
ncbi:aldo-keto reductase family 1 member B1-like [Coccinella septempunctata]|uniref:aldo-keto reductase family 1 member B1-like n=1 Tax=Coccinella septempunctata TaxID=41139 RepID=UPI001D0951B4|nr:aldo-keto reductase family 1 member B1-like [Coccinella septempunctata]